MDDKEFLALSEDAARAHVATAKGHQRDRLILIYANAHNLNLAMPRRSGEPFTPAGPGVPDSGLPMQASAPTATRASPNEQPGAILVKATWAAAAVSALLVFWGLTFDVGVSTQSGIYGFPDRVANADLMAMRQMIFSAGLAFLICAFVSFSGSVVAKAAASR